MLDAAHLPTLLRSIRGALFPNNAPGVSTMVAPSDDEELRALRRRCASALLGTIPPWLASLYLGGRGLGLFRWRSGPESGAAVAAAAGAARASEGGKDAAAEAVATSSNTSDNHGSGVDSGTETAPEEVDEEQEQLLSEIELGILDVFSDEYCNRHLVYGILELILVRLMPELTDKTVAELLEERLNL
ncbi:pxa domain-containing protein [Colletotrichum plurivorum]|uniref:Pxa domain-containing protein n=1 Tax=Colletotrichum plurivorum TaxID=2175906 RepID=A0A8H6KVR2_9PEZI|nr:pxa domain-containing protein [Colletotrichum plurivorum]